MVAGITAASSNQISQEGKKRLAAKVLALSLVPTTLAGHPFWEATEPRERNMELIQCGKNLGVMGGLLLLA